MMRLRMRGKVEVAMWIVGVFLLLDMLGRGSSELVRLAESLVRRFEGVD